MRLILALLPVLGILLASEFLWRKKVLVGEIARKFIHVLAGIWIAFWPYYLPFNGIFILSVMMLFMVIYSRYTNLFQAINGVERKTYGDIFYALGLVVCAILSRADWIFTVSVLLLSVADGVAAVTGSYLGTKNTYYVFGNKYLRKSITGTATYFVFASLVMLLGLFLSGADGHSSAGMTLAAFIVLPLSATVLENITPLGFDNVVIPCMSALILNTILV
jgi:dolichol kinase